MEFVETIRGETREICSRLQVSKLSRPRLFQTMGISGCRDPNVSCRDYKGRDQGNLFETSIFKTALSNSTKIAALSQEVARRLLNTSRRLENHA